VYEEPAWALRHGAADEENAEADYRAEQKASRQPTLAERSALSSSRMATAEPTAEPAQ